MVQKYGIINEVGDLGLGFDPLSPKDQELLNEQEQLKEKERDNKNVSKVSNAHRTY